MITPWARVRRTTLASLAAATALLGACRDGADTTAPAAARPARVAFNTLAVHTAAATADVRISVRSLLQNGSSTVLSAQTIALTGTGSQQVPISIDISPCLRDSGRAGMGGAAPATDECVVQLTVELVLDGVSVDRQNVGPLSLRPGVVESVQQPLTLSDIKEILLTAPPANVVAPGQPLRLEVARTMVLTAQILDGARRVVTGRTPTWSSSSPGIATVSATGVVTAVAPGAAQIIAETAGRIGLVDVRVVAQPQLLTVQSSGFSGAGTVRSQPAGIDCTLSGSQASGTCSATFPGDVQVGLTATPISGTELAGWAGDCSSTQGALCTIPMDRPRTVGVVFRALRVLSITAAGTGTGTVSSDQGNLACVLQTGTTTGSCTGTFIEGAVVTLTASAVGQSSFTGWTGDCAGSTGNSCRLTMTASRTATARFDTPISISISGTGLGNGRVTSSPAGLSCDVQGNAGAGTCVALFAGGTTVTLTAVPSAQNAFRRWGQDCATATGSTCTLVVSGSAKTVSVQFDPPSVLRVSPSGTGDGSVVAGSAISCTRTNGVNSGRCSAEVPSGTRFTLTPIPGAQSEFTGWTGSCSGTASCEITVDEALTVGAVFTQRQVPLALELTGPEFGSVRVNDTSTCSLLAGESSRTCIVSVDIGRVTRLVASPGAGQQFGEFSGACASSTTICSFTVSGPSAVTAQFGAPVSRVMVTPSTLSTGNGDVYTSDESLSCSMVSTEILPGSTCAASFAPNASVTLFAVAEPGYAFVGWGGACLSYGAASSCTLSANGDVSVTARFEVQPSVTVTVSLTGSASGSVIATGASFSRQCDRPLSASGTTVCSWSIPQGQAFSVSISGQSGSIGFFTSSTNQLCYQASSPCDVSALSAANALSVNFFFPLSEQIR
jgi:hypothetical protein